MDEIFDKFGKKTKYFIETRLVDNQPLMEKKLMKMIEEKGLQNKVVIQSFSAESLKEVKSINPDKKKLVFISSSISNTSNSLK